MYKVINIVSNDMYKVIIIIKMVLFYLFIQYYAVLKEIVQSYQHCI